MSDPHRPTVAGAAAAFAHRASPRSRFTRRTANCDRPADTCTTDSTVVWY